jgi:hypothetical protein
MYNGAQISHINGPPTGKWTTELFDYCEDSGIVSPFLNSTCHVSQNYELLLFFY